MAIDPFVKSILDEQHALVMAIDDPSVIEAAKEVAFYSAMIDAALDSPLDDPKDQAKMYEFLKETHTKHVENYQRLVNRLL